VINANVMAIGTDIEEDGPLSHQRHGVLNSESLLVETAELDAVARMVGHIAQPLGAKIKA